MRNKTLNNILAERKMFFEFSPMMATMEKYEKVAEKFEEDISTVQSKVNLHGYYGIFKPKVLAAEKAMR
jgi:hypothetical protein